MLKDQTRGALLVMCSAFLWGTTGIIVKAVYSETNVGPISLALFRLAFAIPILVLFATLKGYRFSLTRREVALFAGFGFCSLTVFETLYFTSFVYTTVQHATALLYTAPGFVALFAWLILREHFTRGKLVAVVLSILGAFLIVGLARGEPLFATRTQVGDWLAIGSGLAYSSWYIFGKILGKDRDPAVTCIFALCFGALFLLPLTIITGGMRAPNGLLAWLLIAEIGIVPTAIGYMLYFAGLRLVDATKASVLAIVEPLSASILAFFFLQETLSYDSLLGFILIISSIVLISRTRS
jgi:DME family drug/metabolite transporter